MRDGTPAERRRRTASRRAHEALEAAQALGVSEADVMAVLESGELKGKDWRHVAHSARRAYGLHGPIAIESVHSFGGRGPREARVPPPAALRPSGTRPLESSRVLSVAPSRRRIDRETGKVVEVDLVATLRALPDEARGWHEAPLASVPVVPRGDGVRGGAGRPELRVLRVAGAGRLHGDQGANQAAGHPAVPHRHGPRSRRDSHG